eukprot:TRINITY_DN2414_c0_g1_i14.p1 TRINITY_DN2414_c0_g1~~TRINITY_DN2414_c0_g1_i14.p1  ORF type:complete len:735 (-),score=48.41 TRINITY_DN2414_c0_g1_i14:262-2295(-)
MATQWDLHCWCKPSQTKLATFNKTITLFFINLFYESCFSQVHLCRNFLPCCIVQFLIQQTHSRWVATESSLCKSIGLIQFYRRFHDGKQSSQFKYQILALLHLCSLTSVSPIRQGGRVSIKAFSMASSDGSVNCKRIILWFKNDLRLHDNYTIHEAVKAVKEGKTQEVLPLYCFDPRFFDINIIDRKTSMKGTPKMGPYRTQFLLESVLDLKQNLRKIGSDLLIQIGKPELIIPQYIQDSDGTNTLVLCQEEPTYEEQLVDKKVSKAIQKKNGQLQTIWGWTLYHKADLPLSERLKEMPNVFTPFRNLVEENCRPRKVVPTPQNGDLPPPPSSIPSSDLDFIPSWEDLPSHPSVKSSPPQPTPKAAMHKYGGFIGGESAALGRLDYYLWDKDLLRTYFETRNGMLGDQYSTKFAPWLAHGCLSPRTIYHEIKNYESQRAKNKSTYWVVFELIWRDYFKFFSIKHGNRIFFEGGTINSFQTWSNDSQLFQRWKDGMTGMPLVDANMRELKATGFMSNRGRQNVASYLVLDLGIDWRLGADYFEHVLIDYDTSSNWGNWVAAAGLTGGRVNKFNITKQSKDYDLNGAYIKHWIPELKNVPGPKIHEPWKLSRDELEQYGVQLGKDYPNPISASRMMRYSDNSSSRNGGNRRNGGGGGNKAGRGGKSRQGGKRSNFEMYG